MSITDLFDEVAGNLDLLDKLESWIAFALAPKSKRAHRFGRLDLVQYSIPRADKMDLLGKRTVNLHETMEYLKHFGVLVKCNGFDSQNMYFQIRRSQKAWADRLLNLDEDGIPQLDYSRQSWQDKRHARKRSAKQSTLGKLAKNIFR